MAKKQLSARTERGQSVGMESEETLFTVYMPTLDKVIHLRAQGFWPCRNEGIARQSARQSKLESNSHAEGVLVQAFLSNRILLCDTLNHSCATKLKSDTRLPRSSEVATLDKLWCKAIDR